MPDPSSFQYITSGWEDGKFTNKEMEELDRWTLQAADQISVKLGQFTLSFEQDPHSPHLGGYAWGSSFILSCYLECLFRRGGKGVNKKKNLNVAGKNCLELGAGIGVPGIVLSKLEANVIMTDIPELVPRLQRNVALNQANVTTMPLVWGEEYQKEIERIKREFPLDFIFAADCIYSEASATDLVYTMNQLCDDQGKTTIYCMSEVRNQAAQDAFVANAEKCLKLEILPTTAWHPYVPEQMRLDFVRFYRLTKL
ncbi:hypothetical protein K7432_003439 [Basidiobolus ranarum]|uniref:Uncharacterized protein n=1 Tax=Basidiobolus ranarum TaxID=34480 RepID=A0ABR2WZT9_9FUNG